MDADYDADAVGICPGTLLVDPFTGGADDVERSARASAEAGFGSLALWTQRVEAHGLEGAAALFDGLGLRVRAVEAAIHWGAGAAAAADEVELHLEVAAALGADILQAADLSAVLDFDRAVEGFAVLCERAGAYGVRVCIEFVPWLAIPDLETAWRIVEAAGAWNGGICLDLLHWQLQPGGPAFDLLREIPGDRIPYVQLCDAPSVAPTSAEQYLELAMSARPVVGEGVVDVAAVLDALAAIDARPYFALEAFNRSLAAGGATAMARRLREATAAAFT
jgi:sugar phosphate isomerase/epimerase